MTCQHCTKDRKNAHKLIIHACIFLHHDSVQFMYKQPHKALACAQTCALCHCCADVCLDDCCSSPTNVHSSLDAHVFVPTQMHQRSVQSLEVPSLVGSSAEGTANDNCSNCSDGTVQSCSKDSSNDGAGSFSSSGSSSR